MVQNKNRQKIDLTLFISRFALKLWLPFVVIELTVLVLAGLSYFLLLFGLFYLLMTSAVFSRGAMKRLFLIVLGSRFDPIMVENLIRPPKWYVVYWLFSNIAFLGIAMFSFRYNVRLVSLIFK